MQDMFNDENNEDFEMGEDMSFADMLDAYDYSDPERGQMLEGVIMQMDETEIIVDVGLKRDAFVPRQDLDRLEEEVIDDLHPGKQVAVYVLYPRDTGGNLIVSINKALEQEDWNRADKLMEEEEVVTVRIVGFNRGGVLADFGRIRGFIPQSHLVAIPRGVSGDELKRQKESLIGEEISVVVIEVNRERNRLVLSEREARPALRQSRIDELEEGQIVTGTVVGLVDYGAFIDIGGIDGLIHISNLDTRYVRHPSDFLAVGDEVTVRIDSIDRNRERINLNRKVLMPDPWDSIEDHYTPGSVVEGIVTNIVDFGIFVALPHGFEGLVHESEMETVMATGSLAEGTAVNVRILEIDQDQQRISLSLDAVTPEEMAEQLDKEAFFEIEEGLSMDELDSAPSASMYDDDELMATDEEDEADEVEASAEETEEDDEDEETEDEDDSAEDTGDEENDAPPTMEDNSDWEPGTPATGIEAAGAK